jgi:hypothetical protein
MSTTVLVELKIFEMKICELFFSKLRLIHGLYMSKGI